MDKPFWRRSSHKLPRHERQLGILSSSTLGRRILKRIVLAGIWIGTMNSFTTLSIKAQTMGGWGLSNGSINIPVTTLGTGKTSFGSQSVNIINQSDQSGLTPPNFSITIPLLPKATAPEQLIRKSKYYQPDLGPFEPNR